MSLDRVVMVGGDKATKPLSEFAMDAGVASAISAAISAALAEAFAEEVTVAPVAANSTGAKGQWIATSTHLHLCVDTDSWVRVALADY